MTILTLNLSKEAEQKLDKDLKHLEETTKKPREYHIKEALIRYIEDVEDVEDVEKYIEKKKKGQVKYYTSEEAEKRIKGLRGQNA